MKLIDPNPDLRQMILDAEVWQPAHTVLNSGLHTDIKLDMERLLDHRRNLIAVMTKVADIFFELEVGAVVPVPDGARRLLAKTFPMHLPQVVSPLKAAAREFTFDQPWKERHLQKIGRVAVFDDVLTTGGSPLAVAETVRHINPDLQLDLVAIWRRANLKPEVEEMFQTQSYLIEEEIPAWPAKECRTCPTY
jgi:orotate phosphoribosyltransferase